MHIKVRQFLLLVVVWQGGGGDTTAERLRRARVGLLVET